VTVVIFGYLNRSFYLITDKISNWFVAWCTIQIWYTLWFACGSPNSE